MMRDRGELVAVVSMDLSKAFDVIQYPLLLSKLKAMVWTIQVVLYSGTIFLVDLRELKLGIASPTGEASDVGSHREVC